MLQPRHTRKRSQQPSVQPTESVISSPSVQTETGIIEWSRTATRSCLRLLASLQPIYNRGERFTGVAGDAYGLLLSHDSAFIFPYTHTSSSSSSVPPILTFPLPQGEEKLLGALIPGPSHEPGLLVVMPTSGRVGYWSALHSALAPSSGIESKLSLAGGEFVSQLCNAGAAGLVLATSTGRMMHVSLRDAVGKAAVSVTNMSSTTGWLGALKSVAVRKDIVAVKAGAAQSREERQVHTITRHGGLIIWEVARGGNYRVLLDCDLWPLLSSHGVSEVLDVVAYPVEANSILLLAQTSSNTVKLLMIQFSADMQPSVEKTIDLPRLDDPKIHLPNPGHVAFVQTRSSVHLVHIADGVQDAIILQSDVEIVATGIEDQLKNKRNPALILITRGAGVIRLEIYAGASQSTDAIKSRLEQAVFFGPLKNNPVSFHPAPKNADIMVRELSKEILDGSSTFLQKSVNVRDMLQGRIHALQHLTNYIKSDVKSTTLQVLREHGEKLAAAEALWNSTNARIEESSIIARIVPITSPTSGKPTADPLRSFFLYGIAQIAELITNAHHASVQAAAAVLDGQALSAIVLESNEIMLAILLTATQFRDEHTEYGKAGEKWTSTIPIIQAATIQLSICHRLVAGLKHGEGHELKDQIVGLTALNCRLYDDYLVTASHSAPEYQKVAQKYTKARPEWLKDLVTIGRVDKALEIGEKFKDFQTLIEICHDQGESAKDEDIINSVVRRLEWYLHTFGYDFAAVLWEYYISHRQFWNLLHEFPNYREYLTQFFSAGKYPNISWMNDVILGDFDKAGTTLLAVQETRIDKKKIQLSIAKLALLVNNDIVPISVDQQIQSSLIMDAAMTELKQFAHTAIDTTAAVDLCIAQMVRDKSRNPDRNAIMRRHMTKLLQGEILSTGEAIDYLTTKTNPNFFDALRLLSYAASLPPAVQAFSEQLIWRRCFISDDWIKIVDTQGQSDATVESVTSRTNLFHTVQKCLTHQVVPEIRLLSPKDAYFADRQVTPFAGLSNAELASLKKECGIENELLDKYEAVADLQTWYAGIIQVVRTAASQEDAEEDDFVHVEHSNDDVFMQE